LNNKSLKVTPGKPPNKPRWYLVFLYNYIADEHNTELVTTYNPKHALTIKGGGFVHSNYKFTGYVDLGPRTSNNSHRGDSG